MFGLRISKTLLKNNVSCWPGEHHRLDVLLQPVEDVLRPLWWAAEDAEFDFPAEWILEGSDDATDEWEPLSGRPYQQFEACFKPGFTPKVARPGFLPTNGHLVSGDWSILYGLPDDPSADRALRAGLAKLDWFSAAGAFPPPVSVVIRGVDWAYWEVFFREEKCVDLIERHLDGVRGLRVERPALPE